MRTVVLAFVAVLFVGMGLYALCVPAALARPFGLSAATAVSRAEIRAVYGGFGIAVAGVLFWSAFGGGDLRTGAALTVGFALAGMAGGRIVSWLIDRGMRFYPIWFYCVVELVGAGLLLSFA
ncbi:DUF4345 domain-containing protein [Nocardia altamirensis]|uniref:DUF4345 domain-containing protein n=1 Tax=Nocardia altamirensis TaxID=472158 RepID=UPI00083FE401|nr:DUF4345 domain-containing protein [Nocardia altamirensis]